MSTTWTLAGSPYIVTGDVEVRNGVAPVPILTIQAGVTVKFNSGRLLRVGSLYPGELQAVGTAAQPIIFTANTATPTPGFWYGIHLSPFATSTSRITYATITYGGVAGNYGGIHVDGSSPTLQNITVQNNAQAGISVNGGAPTISNSTLSSNPWGLWVRDGATVSVTSTTISSSATGGIYGVQIGTAPPTISLSSVSIINNTGYAMSLDPRMTLGTVSSLTVTGNTNNAAEIRGGAVDRNTTWKTLPVPYVVSGDVTVQKPASTPVLTIAAGTTVKFNAGRILKVAESYPGKLTAVGTATNRIVLTANTASPPLGFWSGVVVYPLASSTSAIAYADVSYGGTAGNWGGVHARTGMTFDHVRFVSNSYAGLSTNTASPVILNCDFTGNTAGLVNQTPTTVVDARLNWWNSATGPSGGGPGTGQSISGAKYMPWLATAAAAPQSITSFTLNNSTFNPSIGINANFTFATALSGTWTLTVTNGVGATVRTLTGSGTTGAPSWNGKNDGGVDQPDGSYTYQVASTTGGSQSAAPAKGFSILDRTRQLSIANLNLAPPFFSPNGDAIQESAALSGIASFDGATWTVNVKNSGGTVVRTATGPANPAISYVWDGKNGSNVIQPDGAYTLELIVTDGGASVTNTPTTTLDNTLPTSAISAPAAGVTLSNVYSNGLSNINVTGTSSDANLQSWTLSYGSGASPGSWTNLGTATTAVTNALLATWATYPLTNGVFTLRLVVADQAGNSRTTTRTTTVGNFKVSANRQTLDVSAAGTVIYTSTVPFSLTQTLIIKDVQGQTVATLFNGSRAAGVFTDIWNGRNALNAFVPAGTYSAAATVTAGASSMVWDPPPAPVTDDTVMVGYQHNGWWTAPPPDFWPVNNKPFLINYTVPQHGNPPRPLRAFLLFTPDWDSVRFFGSARPSFCSRPGNFCILAGEYQGPGNQTIPWYSLDNSRTIRTDIKAMVVMLADVPLDENRVVVLGSMPVISNFLLNQPYLRPGYGPLLISLNTTTFQGQTATATAVFERLAFAGVLRTLTGSGGPGAVSLQWDGRADNGMFVAPGYYLVTVTIVDGLGNRVVRQTPLYVQY